MAGPIWHSFSFVFTRPERPAAATELPHPTVPPARPAARPAAGAAPRPTTRRRQPRPQRRRRPQNHPGPTRTRQHRAHRRHLHQRPATPAIPSRRRHRPTHPHRRPRTTRQTATPPHPAGDPAPRRTEGATRRRTAGGSMQGPQERSKRIKKVQRRARRDGTSAAPSWHPLTTQDTDTARHCRSDGGPPGDRTRTDGSHEPSWVAG